MLAFFHRSPTGRPTSPSTRSRARDESRTRVALVGINVPRRNRLLYVLFVSVVALTSACDQRQTLKLQYLRGFVPGTRNAFEPARIAITPPGGLAAAAEREIGVVYGADEKIETKLYATNLEGLILGTLVTQMRDSGLDAFAVAAPAAAGKDEMAGADFLLTTEVEEFRVTKRIGSFFVVGDCVRCHSQPVKPILDRYFTMTSRVRLRFGVRDRNGTTLCTGSISGSEDEPPTSRPGESFLPLETEPAESLSVALSRAIGSLPLDPALGRVLRECRRNR